MIEHLNEFHLEDMNNPDHPSIFSKHEQYLLFIFRLPIGYNDKLDELIVRSNHFAIFGDKALKHDMEAGRIIELSGGSREVYEMADRQTDAFMRLIDGYIDDVSNLEEEMLEKRTSSGYMERWFYLKKDLNRIERLMIPAMMSVDELLKELSRRGDELTVGFQDIKEHLERTQRFIVLNIRKLDEIYALYSSIINEKMNKTIYMLAIISAIFLPLNFIVSFFGINTGGLFFAEDARGTIKVVWLISGLVVTVAALLFVFRKKIFD